MSALPLKADMRYGARDVRFVPIADIGAYQALLKDLILSGSFPIGDKSLPHRVFSSANVSRLASRLYNQTEVEGPKSFRSGLNDGGPP